MGYTLTCSHCKKVWLEPEQSFRERFIECPYCQRIVHYSKDSNMEPHAFTEDGDIVDDWSWDPNDDW